MPIVTLFSDIRKKYPEWNQLKEFLTGDEGGKLIIIGNGPIVIIRYDKKTSNFNIPYVHAFRSVVWDTLANIPLSIAPFKASNGNPQDCVIVQDFVEGVMIQAYIIKDDPKIYLATRTKLGADTRFYSKKNFSELICDAPEYNTLTSALSLPYTFMSIVLQHPEHRIVKLVEQARLFITSMGYVHNDGTVEIEENPSKWSKEAAAIAPQSFLMPTDFNHLEFTASQVVQNGWQWQGFVMKNINSLQRWRFRNPLYIIIRDLRGSESELYGRFLRLRRAKQLHMYISYYPEETKELYDCDIKFGNQIQELFNEYNAVHRGPKSTRKSLKDVGWPLNKYIHALHGIYINKLKSQNMEININTVIEYINELDILKQRALLVTPVGGKYKMMEETDETITPTNI